MDYEGPLHSKKALPGTVGSYKPSSLFRSSSLLSHQGRRSLLSQNLGQKPQEKQLSCDMLLKLSRYILMDTFGPSLAWNLFRFYNCDQEVNLPQIHISPLKVAQHKVKPFLLRRVLQLFRHMGVLSEAQQSKAFSRLKKQMLKPRKTPLKPKVEQSGEHLQPPGYSVLRRSARRRTAQGKRALREGAGGASYLPRRAKVTTLGSGVPQPPALLGEAAVPPAAHFAFEPSQVLCWSAQSPRALPGLRLALRPRGARRGARSPQGLGAGEDLAVRAAGLSPAPSIWAPVADTRPGWRDRPRLGGASSSASVNSAGTASGWKMDINREAEGRQPERRSGSCLRLPAPAAGSRGAGDREGKKEKTKRQKHIQSKACRCAGSAQSRGEGAGAAHVLRAGAAPRQGLGCHSLGSFPLSLRQPWALVGILGGDQLSTAEDKREYRGHGTTGFAVAQRDFLTYDGTRFTVTAFSGWIKGVPHNGFKVEVSKGIILHLVDEVTSWLPGDRIVIASTDYSMHQAEEFNLLPCPECKSNQVKIDGSPLYLHIGEVIDGIDMRAEVGLLTRNILIQGEMEDSCYGQNQCQFFSFDTFGGHIKILRNFSSVHMSGVELKNMGQQILGSYPVHFHLAEDVDERGGYERPTYLDNLAIHHCFSRCVAIHGTHGLLVKDTIGYDTLGHCFFLEDGTEQRNTFYHNLGLLTRSGTILPSDRNEAMCLAIRSRVYGNYVPVPSTDCMAVSTFWIANPNNNLIENAAAGAQDVGIWYIFHRVPTGQSEGQYPEGQAEHTPLGIFYNNRVHSNFKAGLFIGKGVKTTRASAEDPREYLTVDNARFHPHQDADPEKPRVPAVIDGLIAFKNNDHGAWARGGDIIFRNSGFSDNGIGLTLASDGTFPTDEGSSLEVTHSIFVGESSNFGSQGGQNSYWGKGANGEYRTLPRNKTFPIRGFQIYDGPVRMAKCTFKKFTPTVDRYSSAIGFFMKNSWQISPQNNVSQILMEKSVGLKVFFGRSGEWFGNNDNDGDKMSIFHDLDGSVTGYPDTFIGRADNYLLRHPGCLTVPRWNGVMCTGKFAQLYIQARRPENLTLSIARAAYHSHPLQLQGVNRGAPYQQYQPVVMLEQAYIIQWDGRAPEDIILYPINFNRGDWLHVALCYPREAIFQVVADIYQRRTGTVHSVKHYLAAPSRASALNRTGEQLFYFDRASGYLFVHLQAHEARRGHSYCSQQGCERVKITAHMSPGDSWSCDPNPFPERPAAAQHPVSQHPAGPCRACGAPQLAITSTPSVKYIRIQIQSLSRVDIQNHLTSAFIKINDKVFLFNSRGIFFVVLDACSGAVVSRQHFDAVTGENAASTITDYVQTFIKERSLVLVCSRDIADVVGSSEMSVFTRLGSAKPIVFHKEGSFAMLGYKGQAKPSWIKVLNHAGYQKAASLQHYVPLKLKEYQCPANADKLLKFAFSQNHSEHISAEPAAPRD
ncbi:PREDICTED: transmembrane protein 2-like [Nipponia nippon]|uniref:transmembrane protein 2-like n=1 Tax=Nipponia nippon TaxID=128390 RepID=UPI0005108BEF|nr:PREDICTED: transmembrane protein 2-like [Nipponia nippon]